MITSLSDQRILADRVHHGVKQAILSLELEPGAPLAERDLAARFGVSKSPVRDALHRLAGEGLVAQSAYHATTVRIITPDEADEIYALREVLEEMAVVLATPRLVATDIEEAHRCLSDSLRAMDQDAPAMIARTNSEFHAVFSRKSGNRPLLETLSSLQDQVRIISVLGWRHRPSMREDFEQHSAVLDAAVAGDAAKAGHLMRDHVHCFRRSLQAWGESQSVENGRLMALSKQGTGSLRTPRSSRMCDGKE